jgi:hypothetical protein
VLGDGLTGNPELPSHLGLGVAGVQQSSYLRACRAPSPVIRTLKEQCLWARLYEDVEDLRRAGLEFTRRYNEEWLIERYGHCTPREAYAAAMESKAA